MVPIPDLQTYRYMGYVKYILDGMGFGNTFPDRKPWYRTVQTPQQTILQSTEEQSPHRSSCSYPLPLRVCNVR